MQISGNGIAIRSNMLNILSATSADAFGSKYCVNQKKIKWVNNIADIYRESDCNINEYSNFAWIICLALI